MSALISVQLDRVEAFAAELATLARALADETPLCRSTARSLSAALGDRAGWWAAGAAHGFAGLADVLAERCDAIAATLAGAAEEYRRHDTLLSQRVTGPVGYAPIAR
ncbi:hypothetical protein ACI797_00375 [Geodermatophilus sp. SYSU D00691]